MFYISAAVGVIIFSNIIWRYIPVRGVKCKDESTIPETVIHLDVRDYNVAAKDSIPNTVNIPVVYLNRYFQEIESKKVFVYAEDNLEKNVSIRFLRKKGFDVVGYKLTNCKCKELIEQAV